MSAKKGLGRGFESLIPTQMLDEEFDPTLQQDEQVSQLRHLAIDKIAPDPDQPRRHFDDTALQELSTSIKEHGILQPIVVVPRGDKFLIIAGERRWRAAKLAGLARMPALVRTADDQHKLELALIENLQREDLNILETATAYLKLNQQFNLTYEQIGQRVGGKAVSTISNQLRLLQLPKEAKDALVEGKISEGHARQVLAIREPEVQQELLELILKHEWTVRKAEQFVVGYREGKKDKKTGVARTQSETPQTKAIGKRLKTTVAVRNMAHGGQLIIRFKDDADFERIVTMLK